VLCYSCAMQQAPPTALPNEAELAGLSCTELLGIVRSQAQTIEALTAQVTTLVQQLE